MKLVVKVRVKVKLKLSLARHKSIDVLDHFLKTKADVFSPEIS